MNDGIGYEQFGYSLSGIGYKYEKFFMGFMLFYFGIFNNFIQFQIGGFKFSSEYFGLFYEFNL